MEKKDLIIGVCSNLQYDDVKPWVKSSRDCGFKGDVVLMAIDMDEDSVKKVEADDVKVIKVKPHGSMRIHMERFYHIHKFLSENGRNYDYVTSTDVRDVIFQRNPSDFFDFFTRKQGVSSGEAIQIKNEHWNRDNIIKNFGEYFYESIKEEVVQCVGILSGTASYIKNLSFYIYQMSLNRPDWVADQAAYNMIIHNTPWKQLTHFSTLKDAWAINCHVTNYERDKQKFEPYLLEKRPYFKDGLVVNSDGEPFHIVHQYDRVSEWKSYYEQKYNIKIKSQYV